MQHPGKKFSVMSTLWYHRDKDMAILWEGRTKGLSFTGYENHFSDRAGTFCIPIQQVEYVRDNHKFPHCPPLQKADLKIFCFNPNIVKIVLY